MTYFQYPKRYRLFQGQLEETPDGPYMLVSEHMVMVDHLTAAIHREQKRTEKFQARADALKVAKSGHSPCATPPLPDCCYASAKGTQHEG